MSLGPSRQRVWDTCLRVSGWAGIGVGRGLGVGEIGMGRGLGWGGDQGGVGLIMPRRT